MRYWKDRETLKAMGVGCLLLFGALVINFYAGIYATEKASNPVTDLILSNIPVFNVDEVFIYGPLLFWIIVFLTNFHHPERLPFCLKAIALFVLIRSVFITLTHIGPFPDQVVVDLSSNLIRHFTFGGDLFFSAHTGLPFLIALVFWDQRLLRIFCIASAVFFGAIVLMGHLHYSIDVLAAFFITFAIYRLAEIFFPHDRARLVGSRPIA